MNVFLIFSIGQIICLALLILQLHRLKKIQDRQDAADAAFERKLEQSIKETRRLLQEIRETGL